MKRNKKSAPADIVAGAKGSGYFKSIAQEDYSSQQTLNLDETGLKFR